LYLKEICWKRVGWICLTKVTSAGLLWRR